VDTVKLYNSEQTGTVVYLGHSADFKIETIKNEPVTELTIDRSGSADDHHSCFEYFTNDTFEKLKANDPDFDKKFAQGQRPIRIAQVHLQDVGTNRSLRKLGIDAKYGAIAEQIVIDGLSISACHSGSTVYIGNEVVLRITTSRIFCPRFTSALTLPEGVDLHKIIKSFARDAGPNNNNGLGVYTQVLKTGTIRLGDKVRVDPTTSPYYGNLALHLSKTHSFKTRYKWYTLEEFIKDCWITDEELKLYRYVFDSDTPSLKHLWYSRPNLEH